MKLNKLKVVGMVLILAFTFLFVGCSNSVSENEPTESITLAIYPLTSPYFEFAMEEMGEFDKYGANVELVYFAQYGDVIQALDSGNVDGAIMGITEAVSPIVNDIGLKVIAMTDYSYGMDGLVVADSISDLGQLKGETIATNIGTMNHMLLLHALEEVGLSSADVNITNMSEGDAAAAFIGGSIRAASIFDPQMTKAEEEGNGTIIYSSKDMKGQLADVLLMNEKAIQNKPDQVQGIVNAWFSIQNRFKGSDKEEIVSCIAKNADMSEEEFLGLLNGIEFADVEYNSKVFGNEGREICDLIDYVANFLKEADCIDTVPNKEAIKAAVDGTFIANVSIGG